MEYNVKNERNTMQQEKLELKYVPLGSIKRWTSNHKKHDLGGIIASIKRYGYKDPQKYEPKLNRGKGGIVEGNGRDAALVAMFKQDPKDIPRGIVVDDDGIWLVPVLFGVDAVSRAAAEAYGLDHNNLTMAGGNFSLYDIASMWEVGGYAEVLQSLAKSGEMPVSMDETDAMALAEIILNGPFEPVAEIPEGEDGDAGEEGKLHAVKIAYSDKRPIGQFATALAAFIQAGNWIVEVEL